MTDDDRDRWNARWGEAPPVRGPVVPPLAFADHLDVLPTSGRCLELACGRGETAVWLALRDVTVRAVDVSDEAIAVAEELAESQGVAANCEFVVWDLDTGLPFGEPVDLVMCHMFRDARLYAAIIKRLAPGGVLAIAVRSEVGGQPGPYSAAPNELVEAFASLDHIAAEEGDGMALLLARRVG